MSSLSSIPISLACRFALRPAQSAQPVAMEEVAARLSPTALDRLARKRQPESRQRFMMGHDLALALATAKGTHEVIEQKLHYGPTGIPFLVSRIGSDEISSSSDPSPSVSISHRHDLVVAAWTGRGPIGVDVEWIQDDLPESELQTKQRALLTQAFSVDERRVADALARQSPVAHRDLLWRWTMKEAVAKASHRAGAIALSDIDTSPVAMEFDALPVVAMPSVRSPAADATLSLIQSVAWRAPLEIVTLFEPPGDAKRTHRFSTVSCRIGSDYVASIAWPVSQNEPAVLQSECLWFAP